MQSNAILQGRCSAICSAPIPINVCLQAEAETARQGDIMSGSCIPACNFLLLVLVLLCDCVQGRGEPRPEAGEPAAQKEVQLPRGVLHHGESALR